MSNMYIEIRGGLDLFINVFHVPAYIRLVSLNKHLVVALIVKRERTSITVYLENREKRNENINFDSPFYTSPEVVLVECYHTSCGLS